MFIYEVFEYEVEASEGSDERAGDGEHHHHREDQQHPGVVLSKPDKLKGLVAIRNV